METDDVEAERAAERQHQLAGPKRVGVPERERHQAARLDLDDGKVRLVIDRDNLRPDDRARAASGSTGPAAPPVASNGSSTSIRVAFATTWALVTM